MARGYQIVAAGLAADVPRPHTGVVQTSLPVLLTLLCAAPAVGQRVLLVDASGKTGQYKTIRSAVSAFKKGDLIRVVGGVYPETISPGKPVNIQGVGDVRVDKGSLTSHPAGARSRFSGIWFTNGLNIAGTAGDLLFEQCGVGAACTLRSHGGSVAFTSCKFHSDTNVLTAKHVNTLFFHESEFRNNKDNNVVGGPFHCVRVDYSIVEFCRCRFRAADRGQIWSRWHQGSPAIRLFGCTPAKISGLTTDVIQGGSQSGRLQNRSLEIHYSVVDISAVQVLKPVGSTNPAMLIVGSTVRYSPTVSVPVIDPDREFARGVSTNIDLHAPPDAASLTWVALDYKVQQLPLGMVVIDLAKPYLSYFRSHDAAGRARIVMDLRNLPSSFVGIQYAMQTVSLSKAVLQFSTPQLGVIGL